jgi:4a-hydroxytetrahydrobiopterin dehydratase
VRKKLKQKSFAAAVNRDDIVNGAEDLGVELNEHIQFMIDALTGIEDELGLSKSGDTTGVIPLTPSTRTRTMEIQATEQLLAKKCLPCEGGVAPYTLEESQQQLQELAGWELTGDNQRIRKEWTVTNFMAGMDFFNRVAGVAEDDAHHPDLHIEGYRNVAIELWTHAIGGLSENDFILAAKIDQLEVKLQ